MCRHFDPFFYFAESSTIFLGHIFISFNVRPIFMMSISQLEGPVRTSQRAHDAIIMSLWRRNDVATSFWRHNDVIIASCDRWAAAAGGHLIGGVGTASVPDTPWKCAIKCVSIEETPLWRLNGGKMPGHLFDNISLTHSFLWYVITHPCPADFKVRAWVSNYVQLFYIHVVIYPWMLDADVANFCL